MSYFDKFKEWQLYAHYMLLSLGLTGLVFFLIKAELLRTYVNSSMFYPEVFMAMLAGTFVIDSVVHLLFNILPYPLKWED